MGLTATVSLYLFILIIIDNGILRKKRQVKPALKIKKYLHLSYRILLTILTALLLFEIRR